MDHQQLTYTERIAELAARDPEAVGLICVDESGAEKSVTYSLLARRSAQVARLLSSISKVLFVTRWQPGAGPGRSGGPAGTPTGRCSPQARRAR